MKTLSLGAAGTNITSPKEVYGLCLHLLHEINPKAAERQETKKLKNAYLLRRATDGLIKTLNKHVPPFTYFGHHPVDTTRWGVWIDLGQLHSAEERGQLVQMPKDRKRIRAPYILDVVDGKITLFRRQGWRVVWTF